MRYVVVRIGTNEANQSWTTGFTCGWYESETPEGAIEQAKVHNNAYANQYFRAYPSNACDGKLKATANALELEEDFLCTMCGREFRDQRKHQMAEPIVCSKCAGV